MHCTRRSRIHLVAREVSSRSGSWRIWEAADMSVAATLSRHLDCGVGVVDDGGGGGGDLSCGSVYHGISRGTRDIDSDKEKARSSVGK